MAVADLAERAAVLPLHARRLRSLLGKARVIDRQDAGPGGDARAQLAPDPRRVPRRVGDEVLEGLIVARVAQPAVHGLHRLALTVPKEPVDILRGRVALRLPTETRTELIEELAQSPQQPARRTGCHTGSVPNLAHKYKSNRQIIPVEPDKVVLKAETTKIH